MQIQVLSEEYWTGGTCGTDGTCVMGQWDGIQ
jgi:hypothetical protein